MAGVTEFLTEPPRKRAVSKWQPFQSMYSAPESPLEKFDLLLASWRWSLLARVQSASIIFSEEGAVAQLGERLICIQEVAGSIPTSSTSLRLEANWLCFVKSAPRASA